MVEAFSLAARRGTNGLPHYIHVMIAKHFRTATIVNVPADGILPLAHIVTETADFGGPI